MTELVLKPTARAFNGFSITAKQDGSVVYEPYALAKIGMSMAGHAPGFVDKLDVRDMNAVAQLVLSFFG